MKRKKKTKTTRALSIIIPVSIMLAVVLFGAYESGLFNELISRTDNYDDAGLAQRIGGEERYIIQQVNTYCGHNNIEAKNVLPKEIFGESNLMEGFGGSDQEYDVPEGWHVNALGDKLILTLLKELCDDCSNKFYLGNFEGEIAIFQGVPPNGLFFKGLEIEVKDVYKEILDEGISYSSPEEKRELLESFTS